MKKRIRHGDPQRRSYWEEVVRRWREGGQSVRAFCRAEELRESAFYFWRRKLAGNKKRDALVTRKLRRARWRVIRIWECDLRNAERILKRIKKHLE